MAPNATTNFFTGPPSMTTIAEFAMPSEWDQHSRHCAAAQKHSNANAQDRSSMTVDGDVDMDMQHAEELSATSHEEASKVLEQWQSDDDHHSIAMANGGIISGGIHTAGEHGHDVDVDVDLEIMKVDEQIGSNLLGEDIFGTMPPSPTGPLEELVYMNLEDEEDDASKFFVPLLDHDTDDAAAALAHAHKTGGPHSILFDDRYQATWRKLEASMKRSRETRNSLRMKTVQTETYSRTNSVHGVLSSIETSSQQLLQTYLQHIQQRNL